MSDKFSKSCFKMSNSFVMPEMVKSLIIQLTIRDFIGILRKYQHITRTQPIQIKPYLASLNPRFKCTINNATAAGVTPEMRLA